MRLLCLFLINSLTLSLCHKILMVVNTPARSHYTLMNTLAKGLVTAGHNVTIIGPFSEKNPPKGGNYREIVLPRLVEALEEFDVNFFEMEESGPYMNTLIVGSLGIHWSNLFLEDPKFQTFLKSNETYDAVVIEQFVNDGLKAIAHHFQAPCIVFSTLFANHWINSLVGNPAPPSYVPEYHVNYGSQMSFWQRMKSGIFRLYLDLYNNLFFLPQQNKIMKKYFPNAPDINDLYYNVSLVLINSHESVNQPIPLVPKMIQIGGFHVDPPKKLPSDLQRFLDEAKEGVVYFSMGSNIDPTKMRNETVEALLMAFGKLKQKVLWKWNGDQLLGKPENVKISKWFPQQDILAHPNVKLFITHGGLLSMLETIDRGVPILAFPIFADQKYNAERIESAGFGLKILYKDITEARLTEVLYELLYNPQYRENAKWRSILLNDRPVKPLDSAVYWIEYIIKHQGAPHLRIAGVDLPWYQYFLLDVISTICLVISSLFLVIYVVCTHSSKVAKVKPD